jgi:hypothetical protein
MLPPEAEQRFTTLVALCEELQAEGRLISGFVVYITPEAQICLKPLPPTPLEGEALPDLDNLAKTILSAVQQVRLALGKWFDMDAKSWNVSDIGKMLTYIESDYRKEVYRMGEGAEGHHNPITMCFLIDQAMQLGAVLLEPKFQKKWRGAKLRILNAFARNFFEANQRRSMQQVMCITGQIILATNEVRMQGINPATEAFIVDLVKTDIAGALQSFFRK